MVEVVGVVGVVRVVRMVRMVRMVGVARMVTLLAEHYFVQSSVSWWWFGCVMGLSSFMDLWSQQEEQLHESLANRLTYGCKPVIMTHFYSINASQLHLGYFPTLFFVKHLYAYY